MYPVLAQEEIQIAELNRRQRLAVAERHRLIAAGIAVERRRSVPATTRRFRDPLVGIVAVLSGFRAARGLPIPDESAAMPSA